MEKNVQRVSKRHLKLPALLILLSAIIAGCNQKVEEVKIVPPYSNPQIENKLKEMKVKQEEEVRQQRLAEIARKEAIAQKKAELQKKAEAERLVQAQRKAAEEKAKAEVKVEVASYSGNWETYKLTHYTANCKGCSGYTATEVDVRNTTAYQGYRVLSVDPRKIPLGSVVEIKDGSRTYKAIAIDTGGAIKGNKLDLLVGSYKEAIQLGKKNIKLRIVRSGWGDAKSKK